MTENEQNRIEDFNITAKWHLTIYNSMSRMLEYELICRVGGIEVAETLSQPSENLPYIKFLFLKTFITEIRQTLDNSRPKLNKGFYLKTNMKLSHLQNIVDFYPDEILFVTTNYVVHTEEYHLTEQFYQVLNTLSQIRASLVMQLQDTLFGEQKDKSFGMDKTDKGELIL